MTPVAHPYPADLRMLTALRAFAALLVVLFHFAARTAPGSVLHTTLIGNGQLGVDVFFVLSGFILAHVYLARVAAEKFALGEFLTARLARLYPMHLVMLVAAAANGWLALRHGLSLDVYGPPLGLDPETGGGYGLHLIANLLLLQAWGTVNGHYFNPVAWSISAEACAYLLFPLIAAAALAFGNKAWLRLMAALAFYLFCEVVARVLLGAGLNELSWRFGILRIVPEFVLGVAVYGLGAANPMAANRLRWLTPAAAAAVIAAMALGAPILAMPPLFALIILLLANAERAGAVPPEWLLRPLVYLGEISYSTYMLHFLLGKVYFNALSRLFGYDPHALPAAQVMLGIVPVLLASAVTFHVIEQPGRRLLRVALQNLAKRFELVTAG
jgi:peptidoglycan/LPS O-acetylase OafA/YrhL